MIGPGFDRVFVDGVFVERADAAPAIVVDLRHRRFVPVRFAAQTPFQRRRHDIVAILEDIRFDHEIVAHDPFDRVAPAIDQRRRFSITAVGKARSMGHQSN